jgi:hypothetical protein
MIYIFATKEKSVLIVVLKSVGDKKMQGELVRSVELVEYNS